MTRRPAIQPIIVLLRGVAQVSYLAKVLPNLPLDPDRPLQVLIREEPRKRKLDANAAYWAGPVADFANQVWLDGRQYSPEVWHEGLKEMFLPDPDDPEFNPAHVVDPDSYLKWEFNPVTDRRTCVGSTTQLTDAGMHYYRLAVEAYGATEHGVIFTTREEPAGRTPMERAS